MPERIAEPGYPSKIPDAEKSLGTQPPDVEYMPSKVEPKQPSSDYADSSEVAEDNSEKEKKGGIKDYFVSGSLRQSIFAQLD